MNPSPVQLYEVHLIIAEYYNVSFYELTSGGCCVLCWQCCCRYFEIFKTIVIRELNMAYRDR